MYKFTWKDFQYFSVDYSHGKHTPLYSVRIANKSYGVEPEVGEMLIYMEAKLADAGLLENETDC